MGIFYVSLQTNNTNVVVMVICYLFMLVSQYKGAAILLEMYTGVSFNAGLVIMMVLVVFFVNMGGLRSVA